MGGQIFSEILPYLEVEKLDEENTIEEVQTPDVLGKTLKEAEEILKENELEAVYETDGELDKENIIIKEQTPKAGIKVNKGSKIYLK